MENVEYVTVKEFADLFRVAKMTVNRWIHDDKVHAIRVGRSWRIPVSEITRWKEGAGEH